MQTLIYSSWIRIERLQRLFTKNARTPRKFFQLDPLFPVEPNRQPINWNSIRPDVLCDVKSGADAASAPVAGVLPNAATPGLVMAAAPAANVSLCAVPAGNTSPCATLAMAAMDGVFGPPDMALAVIWIHVVPPEMVVDLNIT
jgi:hypothetical protein